MVDDPSAVPEEFPTDESYEHERLRLFALISELVNWENTTTAATMTKTPHHLHRLGEVGLGDGRAPGRQVSGLGDVPPAGASRGEHRDDLGGSGTGAWWD
jgi:hypothetical protein